MILRWGKYLYHAHSDAMCHNVSFLEAARKNIDKEKI